MVSDFSDYLKADEGLTREKEEIIPNNTNDFKLTAKTQISTPLTSLFFKIKIMVTSVWCP